MPSGFVESFTPLSIKLKRYFLELILLTFASVLTIIALVIYVKNIQESNDQFGLSGNDQMEQVAPNDIFVDISGAVNKPNVYQVGFGARLKDVINKAGGLSIEADLGFFYRNFNLSRLMTDQEKIYIPSTSEVANGIYIENSRTLDYTSPHQNSEISLKTTETPQEKTITVNINTAVAEELDQLPGIGQITAAKIINNRPYSIIDDLLTKKIVNKNVYENIKGLITTN